MVAYGGQSEDERLEVLRWMFFDNHMFTSYHATLRFMSLSRPPLRIPAS